ncbi:MAG: hypothetical protein SGJ19_20885 [Planctomycetia bacterium]|nr:hypothetical protein [Planctomycetia bacterium]
MVEPLGLRLIGQQVATMPQRYRLGYFRHSPQPQASGVNSWKRD